MDLFGMVAFNSIVLSFVLDTHLKVFLGLASFSWQQKTLMILHCD